MWDFLEDILVMIIFETERMIIRQVTESDKISMLKFHNEPATMKFISDGKSVWTQDELNVKLNQNEKLYPSGFGIYCIINKKTKEVMGEASVFNSFDNFKHPEIGYIISERFWNQGYGTEVVNGLIHFCKDRLNSERIIARMYSENKFSIRICHNVGMKLIENKELEDGRVRLCFEETYNFTRNSY